MDWLTSWPWMWTPRSGRCYLLHPRWMTVRTRGATGQAQPNEDRSKRHPQSGTLLRIVPTHGGPPSKEFPPTVQGGECRVWTLCGEIPAVPPVVADFAVISEV